MTNEEIQILATSFRDVDMNTDRKIELLKIHAMVNQNIIMEKIMKSMNQIDNKILSKVLNC